MLFEKECIEVVICTRNTGTLHRLAKKYRIQENVNAVDELIGRGMDTVFVSAYTDGYLEIAENWLETL